MDSVGGAGGVEAVEAVEAVVRRRGVDLVELSHAIHAEPELAFDERRLRQALSALDCGPLEILIRGVRVDPDALRRRLRPTGRQPLSVVITRIGAGRAGRSAAFVCRAAR